MAKGSSINGSVDRPMSISPCDLSRFSPEFQLACVCCRVELNEANKVEIQRLLLLIEVPIFLELVTTRHRIGSIVHAALSKLPLQMVPPGLMEPLANACRINAVKALKAQRAHVLLTRWFAAVAIEWFPFKGSTLALRYYQDPSTRHVNDLDIWVSPSSLPLARTVLTDNGFREREANIHTELAARGVRHAAYVAAYFHEEQHYSAEFGALELHWRLADNPYQFKMTPESLVARADSIQIADAKIPVLNDVDLLLYLCDHGARHGWSRLKWLADLPRVLNRTAWDWPAVLDLARQSGCHRALILGLVLCRDLFGWQPPAVVGSEFARSFRLLAALHLIRQSWAAPAATKAQPIAQVAALVLRELALSISLANGLRAVGYQIKRYLLSPNDLLYMKIPDRWFGLYYWVRPLTVSARRAGAKPSSANLSP